MPAHGIYIAFSDLLRNFIILYTCLTAHPCVDYGTRATCLLTTTFHFRLWHGADAARFFHWVGDAAAAATATAAAAGGVGVGAATGGGWVLILSFDNFCWFFPATLFARQISFKFNFPHPTVHGLGVARPAMALFIPYTLRHARQSRFLIFKDYEYK